MAENVGIKQKQILIISMQGQLIKKKKKKKTSGVF